MSEPEAAPGPTEAQAASEAGAVAAEPEGGAVALQQRDSPEAPEPQDSAAVPELEDSAAVPVPQDGVVAPSLQDGVVAPEPQDSAVTLALQGSPESLETQAPPADPQPELSQAAPQPQAGWAIPDAASPPAQFGAPVSPPPFGAPPGSPPPLSAPPGSAPPFGASLGSPPPGWQATAPFPMPGPAPAAKKRPRKRIVLISVGAVTALALVAAGIVALWPGRSGNSIVAVVHCQPTDLTTCLIKAPAGAVGLSDSAQWDNVVAVTPDLYSSNITADAVGISSDTRSLLDSDGLRETVHRDWNAVDGNNVDLVVLQFGSQKGAKSWNATRTGEIMATYRGPAVGIPGDPSGKAFAAAKPDAKGNVKAAYSAVVGDLVLNVAYSSPKTLDAKDLQNWAGTELASLQAAPPPAADPADTAPGTQQVACADRLTSCLMPIPGGSEHWMSPMSKKWISAATLTMNQFVQLEWDKPADQAEVLASFGADGVTGIAHQDWDIDNANEQADIYLIQTITAAGAGQLTNNFGEPAWDAQAPVSVTIPGESQVQAWRTTKTDSQGFIDFGMTASIGNVVVSGWMFFYGSYDSATAVKWAKAELAVINGSVKSVPMGLFPITAPALPGSSQGSCAASGDCLLPVPAGASDTTKSSYQVGHDLQPAVYAAQYEPDTGTEAADWLGSDGFASAEHRAWSTPDGANADVVLVKYGSATQAQAAVQLEYGLNASAQRDRICTDSKLPDSLCLASPVSVSDMLQKETIRVLAWKGDYEVSVSVTKSNAADVTDAYVWAQRQLDLLPAN